MDAISRNVRDIDTADRLALEHVLGTPLREHQQVIIQVVNTDARQVSESDSSEAPALREWCNVYAGLSDEEIDRLDQAIRQRLDLTRAAE